MRKRESIYLSAVASVKMGWMTLLVGVGLERMGREAEAARRRGVVDFGFALASESGFSESVFGGVLGISVTNWRRPMESMLGLIAEEMTGVARCHTSVQIEAMYLSIVSGAELFMLESAVLPVDAQECWQNPTAQYAIPVQIVHSPYRVIKSHNSKSGVSSQINFYYTRHTCT